ncbi:MAG: DeoR family transcriptional regulator [Patescibacteria group bacterium]
MITERQEKLLNFLIKEYISTAEPVSSFALKKITDLDVCGATIRNDLQELAKQGFIGQPHTSAGRIPTKKAYKYLADKILSERQKSFFDFIFQEAASARKKVEEEIKMAEELMRSLSEVSTTLNYTRIQKKDGLLEILEILGPSKSIYQKNINVINEIIKELENF